MSTFPGILAPGNASKRTIQLFDGNKPSQGRARRKETAGPSPACRPVAIKPGVRPMVQEKGYHNREK